MRWIKRFLEWMDTCQYCHKNKYSEECCGICYYPDRMDIP